MTDDPMIAALLRERAGYLARGLTDRVAAVDEQLTARGYETSPQEDPDPTSKPPVARRAPTRRTAAAKKEA